MKKFLSAIKPLLFGLGVALLLATVASAQIPSSLPSDGRGALIDAVSPVAKLTEVELLRLQVIGLQQQLANQSVALESCRIELAHPGFAFDPQKGLVPLTVKK